ncbi:hypothetical protein [Clostridium perfringens]|uniref:hypothetical protein n=1 Tax=Clostridium perfringens TaxID=1502 RepID=UPI001CCC922F|nr:hypothetical protein [Clostridium perfringens]UBL06788.1 hypothetical protein KLF33_15800 [Clostridium perfringens]
MKPILFNTAMVKAILEGKKTCTRRLIKNKYTNADIKFWEHKGKKILVYAQNDVSEPIHNSDGTTTYKLGWMEEIAEPFKVGDILYVRETWANTWTPDGDVGFVYKADGEPKDFPYWGNVKQGKHEVWIPSIHMPKEAARIFLKVTSVRAERLKDITDEGCLNEGIREFTKDGVVKKYDTEPNMHTWEKMPRTPREAFEKLWNSTLQLKGKWNGWKNLFEYNPWVWVIEFKQIENNEVGE